MEPPLPGPRFFNPFGFIRALSDVTGVMLEAEREYGDTFRMPTLFGPVVVTGNPEAVRAIFTADPDTFVPFAPEIAAPLLGETSLALAAGARHRRDRKLLTPPFHGARMRAYGASMADVATRAAAAWRRG